MNKNDGLHIQIIAFALLTSVLTALANLLVENWFSINIFSFGFWIVLPVGAVIVGVSGASGGFLACKYFNIKPNWLDALALTVVAAFTMYLIYYLGYITLILDDGRKASDLVDFKTYLDVVVTKSHMRVGRGLQNDTGEVGGFGYLLLVIKFVGVLLGGFLIFINLKALAMCEKCGVYFKKIASKETLHATTNDAQVIYEKMNSGVIDDYKDALKVSAIGDCEAKIKFTLMRCPKCKDEYISEEFFVKDKDKNFVAVTKLTGKTNIPKDLDLQPLFPK
jgi:hypothetical protein